MSNQSKMRVTMILVTSIKPKQSNKLNLLMYKLKIYRRKKTKDLVSGAVVMLHRQPYHKLKTRMNLKMTTLATLTKHPIVTQSHHKI